jgi:hypothetical protein
VEGARRPCRLAQPGIEAIDQWLGMLRKALERNYDRLDHVLDQVHDQVLAETTPEKEKR